MGYAADTPAAESGTAVGRDADGDAATPPNVSDIDRLLYQGETVVGDVDVGNSRLFATSHRVLALNPAGEARVRSCDRLNVADVRPDTVADDRFAAPTLKALVAGLVLTIAGLLFSFDGLVDSIDAASAPGFEGLVAALSLLLTSLALLDDLLLVAGLLSLFVGLGGLVWYLNSRAPVVRVSVRGSDDIVVAGVAEDQRNLFAFRDLARTDEKLETQPAT